MPEMTIVYTIQEMTTFVLDASKWQQQKLYCDVGNDLKKCPIMIEISFVTKMSEMTKIVYHSAGSDNDAWKYIA